MTRFLASPITLEELLLNSGLNEDCLVEILRRLTICDLIVICDFDSRTEKTFIQLIRTRVAAYILFDIDAIAMQRKWSLEKVFETFGAQMSKIKMTVSLSTFNGLMNKIVNYCNTDKLRQLLIKVQFGFQIVYDFSLMERMRPFLRNLNSIKLKCDNGCQKTEIISVFHYFMRNLNEVTRLTIDGQQLFRYSSTQLGYLGQLKNIKELTFSNVNLETYTHRFHIFLTRLPSIEKFIYVQYNPQVIAFVGRHLSLCYPNLKTFGFITHRFHCSEGRTLHSDFYVRLAFNFLKNFNHLEEMIMGADVNCKHVAHLLSYTPKLKMLSISRLEYLNDLDLELFQIIAAIKKIIEGRYNFGERRIKLIVNEAQNDKLKLIEEAQEFVVISVDGNGSQVVEYE